MDLSDDVIRATFPAQKVLALTAWGEARGDGQRGMQAVINVLANRAANPRWWGKDVVDCCLRERGGWYQFSAWDARDPNRRKMLDVTVYDRDYRVAYELAGRALKGELPDITKGADHYHALSLRTPKWAQGKLPVEIIENHVFYRLEL